MDIPKEERNNNNPLYVGLRNRHNNMMARVYNKNNPKYKSYGAVGVVVDPRWQDIEGYIADADKVEGWDLQLFLKGELQLDKDIKYEGNKLYSRETCKWVTRAENTKVKPNAQELIIGIDPNGNRHEFVNQTDFAKEHNLYRICIHDCVNGKSRSHRGWRFHYATNKNPHKRTLYKATKGEYVVEMFKQSDIAKHLGIPNKKIYSLYREGRSNKYNGYTFERTKDY